MTDHIDAKSNLSVGNKHFTIYKLGAVKSGHVDRLPFSLKVLLENLLRHANNDDVSPDDIEALANWNPKAEPSQEIAFTPSRVILQDFTGVPAVVDLAAMRDAVVKLGGQASAINPLSPAELVIDHSVQVDKYGNNNALDLNTKIEFQRNQERYSFLKWGQDAFNNFSVVPPNTGIVHQVNIEHLARVIFNSTVNDASVAFPDTVVGTDSHTTMVNGLGVLGWGVGGIEAEAAMLGQAITMLIPQVIGVKLNGELSDGTTATDLVLAVTDVLRDYGVVGKFVEFFGDGLSNLPLSDRATLSNMSPEFGSTCAIFPIDNETIRYLKLSGRDEAHIALIEAYSREQGLWREDGQPEALYSDVIELDMTSIVPSLAGPKRPQDRIPLNNSKDFYQRDRENADEKASLINDKNGTYELKDGAVAIAAITSCTNTSNPSVMIAAGLVARKARERNLNVKPWVKTSLAPGSRVVTNYLQQSGLLKDLEALGFNIVGYGCTTCIGNSGPLLNEIEEAIKNNHLITTSVVSGNRNFEGRIHQLVKMNYLASPPLVVIYALAGSMNIDLINESIGKDSSGNDVYLKDLWPSQAEIELMIQENIDRDMFQTTYKSVFEGDSNWNQIESPKGEIYSWDDSSTYVKNPPYFDDMTDKVPERCDLKNARALALLGDSVTTDHISPAGSIATDSPAGLFLKTLGISPGNFNSYGSRRGNHEIMMRGTFANIRLRNLLAPGTEGGWTCFQPTGEQMTIFDAAMKYKENNTPLIIIAGKEYGTGSSRDWAAKGTLLLGVKAVIAESYERIHRSNLIGMGVLPLEFQAEQNSLSVGIDGTESFSLLGIADRNPEQIKITAEKNNGEKINFSARVRIDTPKEWEYFNNGGILHYVLRQLAAKD
ncbi:MAG: aconitate hydratase AcnA [Pseudomonadota bacterium]|nr:aconitate hydratase AcnA [Pseudomonadota bacterium]